jgi:hypothetical protein
MRREYSSPRPGCRCLPISMASRCRPGRRAAPLFRGKNREV